MPRSSESIESKILTYFETEGLEKVQLLSGLVNPIVKRRLAEVRKEAAPRKTKAALKIEKALSAAGIPGMDGGAAA